MQKLTNQFLCSRMMLPEQKEALLGHYQETLEKETDIPSFDEQQLELWEHLLKQSLQNKRALRITYLSSNPRRAMTVTGVAVKFDSLSGNIIMALQDGPVAVPLNRIISLEEG